VAKTTIHRLLSRRDIPLREKTLWRMLYETAARAAEILALNVEDLDLEHRRAPVRSKGDAIEWVYWDTGTAHLLPRLLRLPDGSMRTHGPLFLSERRPVPARRPAAADICPHTGRARLGYDRARVLLDKYAGLDLHQLRHSAATPPRRSRSAAAAHHGQDPAQEPAHRHALRQTRRRSHRQGHRGARTPSPCPLTEHAPASICCTAERSYSHVEFRLPEISSGSSARRGFRRPEAGT
jgi:integrase